jgi:uncharacterized membrane protein
MSDDNDQPDYSFQEIVMIMDWTHAGPSMVAAFLASLVEFVEALTIVLAVGTIRGWRPALIGTAAGLAVLLLIIVALGPALARIPLGTVQLVVGTLLLLFGMRWLRKAILRAAGVIALHDEDAAFASEAAALRKGPRAFLAGLDKIAVATTFKTVILEGIEVVFIVIAIGAVGNLLVPASIGALAALALVVLLGLALHRPLARIPENSLKFTVGVLLSAFGAFWVGEGVGLEWPGSDLALFGIAAVFLLAALASIPAARRVARRQTVMQPSAGE